MTGKRKDGLLISFNPRERPATAYYPNPPPTWYISACTFLKTISGCKFSLSPVEPYGLGEYRGVVVTSPWNSVFPRQMLALGSALWPRFYDEAFVTDPRIDKLLAATAPSGALANADWELLESYSDPDSDSKGDPAPDIVTRLKQLDEPNAKVVATLRYASLGPNPAWETTLGELTDIVTAFEYEPTRFGPRNRLGLGDIGGYSGIDISVDARSDTLELTVIHNIVSSWPIDSNVLSTTSGLDEALINGLERVGTRPRLSKQISPGVFDSLKESWKQFDRDSLLKAPEAELLKRGLIKSQSTGAPTGPESTPLFHTDRIAPFDLKTFNYVHNGEQNNCYNFATNEPTWTFAQPGRGTGAVYGSATSSDEIVDAMKRDGHEVCAATGTLAAGWHRVALLMDKEDAEITGFHFMREDPKGMWSQKDATRLATRFGADGQLITTHSLVKSLSETRPNSELVGFFRCQDPSIL